MLGSWYLGYFFWLGLATVWVELAWGVVTLSLFIIIREVLLPERARYCRPRAQGCWR
jgi:hypothetical protein